MQKEIMGFFLVLLLIRPISRTTKTTYGSIVLFDVFVWVFYIDNIIMDIHYSRS